MANKNITSNLRKLAELTHNPDLSTEELKNELERDIEKRKREEEEKKANIYIAKQELERQKEENILTLESKVDFSRNITNELVLEAEGQTVKYIGYAEDLYFDGGDIRGRARLRRYDLKDKIKKRKRRVSWFPPRTKTEEIKSQEWIKRWGIVSGEDNYDYFLSAGELKTGYDCSAHYRACLKGSAADQGINLSHEIFESVFGPIDKKIMEMYRKFYKSENDK